MSEGLPLSQEMLEILHEEGIIMDLHWSKQLIGLLPDGSPLKDWHQKRIDYWTSRFDLRRELEKEERDGI